MIPRLLAALTQNGAAIPNPAMITPASAGPAARLIFMPTLFAATAGARSDLGTSCGTSDCQAGAVKAAPAPSRNEAKRLASPNRPRRPRPDRRRRPSAEFARR